MNEPLISIIIPVYNVEKYIRKCVDSVLNQTYKNLQVILVDDGSTDKSTEICDEYKERDARVEVVHKVNEGLPAARNTGLERMKGDYVGFIDSDDWVDVQMVEHLLHNIQAQDADISVIEMVKVQGDVEIDQKPCKVDIYTQEEYAKKFFKIGSQKIVHYVCNKLFKSSIVNDKTFEKAFSIGEDVVAFYKMLLKAKKIVSSNQIMYFYRQNTGMTSKFNEKYFGLEQVWKRVEEITKEEAATQYDLFVKVNQARINFTILTEIAIGGEYKNPKYKQHIDHFLVQLKRNRKFLCKTGIAKSRKVMIWLACVNYRFYASVIYRIKGK